MDDYPVLIVHSNSKIQKKICEPRMVKGSFKSVFFHIGIGRLGFRYHQHYRVSCGKRFTCKDVSFKKTDVHFGKCIIIYTHKEITSE